MPARTIGSATVTMTSGSNKKRFELPALDFKFTPLTEGTDIPPPPPSPILEAPAKITEDKPKAQAKSEAPSVSGTNGSSKINGAQPVNGAVSGQSQPYGALKRPAEDLPASPTLSSRPGSIRRLFSRTLLHSAYTNAETEGHQGSPTSGSRPVPGSAAHAAATASIIRPDSRSNGSFVDERRAKRSSGWFRRLRGSGTSSSLASSASSVNGDVVRNKRASILFEEPPKPKASKPAGPPPPMIPELGQLAAKVDLNDDGSLGNDLFKNIK